MSARSGRRASPRRPGWSDERLISACLDGDVEAWTDLLDRYGGLVYSVALQIGLKSDDAADVLQNVSMVMLDHLRDLRASERLSSWLITVTKREAVRVMKRNLQRSGGDLAQELDQAAFESRPPITDDLAARLVDLQEQQIVRDALQRMPERCRLLLEMLFLADTPASYAEIAERLDMPIGSIGPTRKRCLGRLRKLLDEMGF